MIQEFVERSGMLKMRGTKVAKKNDINPLLQTLQLVLTHLNLRISSVRASPVLGFANSQFLVYSHPEDYPMFSDLWQINTNLLVHVVNFFRHHLAEKGEDTVYEIFSQLKAHEKPKAWDSRLVQGEGVKKLGKHWKGTYGKSSRANSLTCN